MADAAIAVLWIAVTLYVVLGGADFGGGLWDLLAGGTARGMRPRTLIDHAIGPVWEANHVWVIFDLVVLWTAFPIAFAAITSTLFIPLVLAVLAIVLRGAGFAFRKTLRQLPLQAFTGGVFALSSLAAPFFMGTVIGAIVTGQVPASGNGKRLAAWTGATPLLIGAVFVGTCAWLAASYLTVDARNANEEDMVTYFSRRARIAGVVTGLFAAATLVELHSSAPRIFDRLTTGAGLPLVIISAVAVAGVFALLTFGIPHTPRPFTVRPLAAAAVTAMLWAWGVAQYPDLLPGSLTLRAGAAPTASLLSILAVFGIVVVVVIPSFLLLFVLRGRQKLSEEDERDVTEADLPGLQAADRAAAQSDGLIGLLPIPTPPSAAEMGKAAIALIAVLIGIGVGRSSRKKPDRRRRRR